jgi:hypothetical protein
MIDSIISKFKKHIIKHCKIKAEQYGTDISKVSVRFRLIKEEKSQEQVIMYSTCKDGVKMEDNSFMDIMHFKLNFDALGYSNIVPPFIHKSLVGICGDCAIEEERIMVYAMPNQSGEDIAIHIYDFDKWVKQVTLAELVLGNMAEQPEDEID